MKKIGLTVLFAAFALVGCSTTTDKAHGQLCTGTKRPYQVNGNWYTPQDHYYYEEVGTASWYGEQFHGRPKSCGEAFNMHGISAAHKTLPIPSVVRVTNVRTGSSVKLLVDDRGPFPPNRIIDLSKGAAVHLGLHKQGLGKVRVECLPKESKAFAQFVSQYGRYGRHPDGRSWETIFRQQFDYDEKRPIPQPLKTVQEHHFPRARTWDQPILTKHKRSFQRPNIRVIPVSSRPFNHPAAKVPATKVNDREIEQLLQETRTYLKRRRVRP